MVPFTRVVAAETGDVCLTYVSGRFIKQAQNK